MTSQVPMGLMITPGSQLWYWGLGGGEQQRETKMNIQYLLTSRSLWFNKGNKLYTHPRKIQNRTLTNFCFYGIIFCDVLKKLNA